MNILIIDDTQSDHAICVSYLSDDNQPYCFFHAYTGRQGLQMYREHPIDCVLLDYHLPDMDGLEVLRQIGKENNASAPVIMMTGEGNEMLAVTAMKLGSQDYLPKKVVTSSALRRAVEHAVERRELLLQMERYRKELERSNHDLEQFANIVAHDLKSPLRAVMQHLDLIRRKCNPVIDDKSRISIAFALEGAGRMQNLIDALFTYARLGFSQPEFGPVNMGEIMENTLDDLSVPLQESRASITYSEMPLVRGNAILLTQLMQNLVSNAIKYTSQAPVVHVESVFREGRWHISVRDNGIGIPQEQQGKIFAIFRRLHAEEEYPGIGLGLAICERIVRLHQGVIQVNSSPGNGATFTFSLACWNAAAAEKQVA